MHYLSVSSFIPETLSSRWRFWHLQIKYKSAFWEVFLISTSQISSLELRRCPSFPCHWQPVPFSCILPIPHLVHCSHCQKSSLSKTKSERMDPAVPFTSERESPGVSLRHRVHLSFLAHLQYTVGVLFRLSGTHISFLVSFIYGKRNTPQESQTRTFWKIKFCEGEMANE